MFDVVRRDVVGWVVCGVARSGAASRLPSRILILERHA